MLNSTPNRQRETVGPIVQVMAPKKRHRPIDDEDDEDGEDSEVISDDSARTRLRQDSVRLKMYSLALNYAD